MLTALVAVWLAAAPPKKIEPPKIEAPKLDLQLPAVPKADGLTRPQEAPAQETKTSPSSPNAAKPAGPPRVESLVHASDFREGRDGYRPVHKIDALRIDAVPGRLGPFKSCLRLASPDGRPLTVKAVIRSATGEELMSSRTEVSFGEYTSTDLVIEWEGFELRRAGDLVVLVTLDGKPAGEFPLPVRGR